MAQKRKRNHDAEAKTDDATSTDENESVLRQHEEQILQLVTRRRTHQTIMSRIVTCHICYRNNSMSIRQNLPSWKNPFLLRIVQYKWYLSIWCFTFAPLS
jgi:hypothetical protein